MEKWVVITSINEPTEAVLLYAAMPGWQVVVVGDEKSPSRQDYLAKVPEGSALHYLDVAEQDSLAWSLSRLTPKNSYTRKNIGYLFAISRGARVIFDTDDDNVPDQPLDRAFQLGTLLSSEQEVLQVERGEHSEFVNVYAHFGQPTMWPRGFPLQEIGNVGAVGSDSRLVYRPPASLRTSIRQGLVDGDPDVDAVFRMTRSRQQERISVYFDATAPAVALRPFSYCPFNSQNTLFFYEAFWALFLPTTTTFRVTDIWRSWIAQRLLWNIDSAVAFYPPRVYQRRNAHSYYADYVDEAVLYNSTAGLVQLLNRSATTDCPSAVADCYLSLVDQLVDGGYLDRAEQAPARAWIDDLHQLGYRFPRAPTLHDILAQLASEVDRSSSDSELHQRMEKAANKLLHLASSRPTGSVAHGESSAAFLPRNLPTVSTQDSVWAKTLVCVVANHGHAEIIPRWLAVWGVMFEHVVFVSYRTDANGQFMDKFHVIHSEDTGGHFIYEVSGWAYERFPHFEGYLVVHDDMFLKLDTIERLDRSKFWFNVPMGGPHSIHALPGWPHWNRPEGTSALHHIFSDPDFRPFVDGGCSLEKIYHGFSDFFYVPARLMPTWIAATTVARRHHLWLEIATPTLGHCIFSPEDVVQIDNINPWNPPGSTLGVSASCHQFADVATCHPFKLSATDYGTTLDFRIETSSPHIETMVHSSQA